MFIHQLVVTSEIFTNRGIRLVLKWGYTLVLFCEGLGPRQGAWEMEYVIGVYSGKATAAKLYQQISVTQS